jgi:hypothetical protein
MKSWVNHNNELYAKVKDIVLKHDNFGYIESGTMEEYYEPVIIDTLNRCMYLNKKTFYANWNRFLHIGLYCHYMMTRL